MSAQVEWNAERCAQLLQKRKRSPTGWRACCPAHEDNDPSLFLADGSDGVALVCYAGCDYHVIAAALEMRGAVLTHSRHRSSMPIEHWQLGPYSSHWDYRDPKGHVVMRVRRWEHPGGKKDIRPLTLTPEGWKWQHHVTPRALFQLDRPTNEPEKPVLLVEGKKTAVAAQKLFPNYIATTWPGGAAAMGQADAGPLKGRDVVLVPDNDAPGRKAMAWWMQHLKAHAKSVRIIDAQRVLPDVSEHWDLADGLAEGRDLSHLLHASTEGHPNGRLPAIDFADMDPHLTDGYVVKGLLGSNSLAAIIGATGSGKTFFSTNLALHIGAGLTWRNCRVRGGLVVYAALERPVSAERRFYAARVADCSLSRALPICIMPKPINLRDPLITYKDPERRIQAGQALERIAQRVVVMALEGDKDAIAEIGNRLDGKPRQEIDAAVEAGFVVNWLLPPHRLERTLQKQTDAIERNGSDTTVALTLLNSANEADT